MRRIVAALVPAAAAALVGQNPEASAFVAFTTAETILLGRVPALHFYDLTTYFPLTHLSSALFSPSQTFGTTSGGLNITAAGNLTFSATTQAPVPEPATLWLIVPGLLGLMLRERRRARV